jgi:hypothetical protein
MNARTAEFSSLNQKNIENYQKYPSFNNANGSHSKINDDSFIYNANSSGAKFQCNRCPCKYKRSSDLYKHLNSKHQINAGFLIDGHTSVNNNNNNINENSNVDSDIIGIDDETSILSSDIENSNDISIAAIANSNSNQNTPKSANQRNNINNNNNISINKSPTSENSSKIAPKKNFNQLNINLQRRLEHERQNINNNVDDGSYECPYCCYKSYKTDNEYLDHVKEHLFGKSFRCILCNSVYKYRGDCVVHLKRKHQKADLYAQNYVQRFNLDQIEISEICELLRPRQIQENEKDEKLYGCAYCDYKANYKGDVFKHQTRRHPGTPKNVNNLADGTSTIDNSNKSNNGSFSYDGSQGGESEETNSINMSFNMNGSLNARASPFRSSHKNNNNNSNQNYQDENYEEGEDGDNNYLNETENNYDNYDQNNHNNNEYEDNNDIMIEDDYQESELNYFFNFY